MPVTPTYPGVYIEEISSGVRTITGVSTSATAFVGYTQRGPTNKAVQLFNFGMFEREFGGLAIDSPLSYALQQFFLNGGSEAWVIRAGNGAARAGISLRNKVAGGLVVLEIEAKTEGAWGNDLRADVDYDTANPASLFNLTVTKLVRRGDQVEAETSESHRNLSMSASSSGFAPDVINSSSRLIRVRRPSATAATLNAVKGTSASGVLTLQDLDKLDDDHRRLGITINGDGPYEFDLFDSGGSIPGNVLNTRLNNIATAVASKVQALKPADSAFATFQCVRDNDMLKATSGKAGENSSVRFSNATTRNATNILGLGVSNGGREEDAATRIRPAETGTVSDDLSALDLAALPASASVDIVIKRKDSPDEGPVTVSLWSSAAAKPPSLEKLRQLLEEALLKERHPALGGSRVTLVDSRLHVVAGGSESGTRLVFKNDAVADQICLSDAGGATYNLARYALGVGVADQSQESPIAGDDGTPPDSNALRGSRNQKTGLYALEDVDLFNILCLPDVTDAAVLGEALAYCQERRAFLLIDLPGSVKDTAEAKTWLSDNSNLRHKNAAAYFPRFEAPDPLQRFRLRPFPVCGAVAGIFARTDSERGVWKAPAGIDAVVRGAVRLTYTLTDPENGTLNPLGLNCLRTFPPVYGTVVWGARTLEGADVQASEWKYIPVRRMALYLEESLFRGTKWVVFEPNDEPLWSQIRLNIGAFLHSLFRQGAFAGMTPRDAYFVKCDKETTTQDDVNRGIVNILVGFAPLKPAEFVMIKIQQISRPIAT